MANTLKVKYCNAFQVGGDAPDDAYYVEALLEDGRRVFHRGPMSVSFFTKEQAESLATRVFLTAKLNPEHWQTGRGGFVN